MSNFGVTTAVTRLAEGLILAGYTGTIELTKDYPAGAKGILGSDFSLKLSGFCKENLYIVQDLKDSEIGLIGRYEVHKWMGNPSVSTVAKVAWDVYQSYKSSGYSRPPEWEEIWIKEGYLKKKVTTTIVEQ